MLSARSTWGMRAAAGGYSPSLAASKLLLHARPEQGVTLTDSGISIAPVQTRQGSLARVDGGSTFYANTQTDTDTVLKPIPKVSR